MNDSDRFDSDKEDSCPEVSATLNFDELMKRKKKDLQLWLQKRNMKISGCKSVLVHRILRSINFDTSDESLESEDSCDEVSYTVPDFDSISCWENVTLENCVNIRHEDVLNYFIYTKNPVSGKTKNCHRQLKKAKKFCNENFLGNLFVSNSNSQFSAIKAQCKPSMKTFAVNKDAYYSIKLLLFKETAFVHSAVCTCKAGLSGVCSHVGGLLFTLVKIKNSCTSQVCQWQRPRKITHPPSPKKLSDLQFTKTDGADKEIPQKPYPGIYQAGPCNDPDKFLADVLGGLKTACPSSVLYQTMSDAVNINDILKQYEPQFMYMDHVDLKSNVCQSVFIDHTNSLKLTHQEIDDVCKATKGQSNNRNWILARTFLLTASNFALICKKRDTTPPENLIKLLRSYRLPPASVPSLKHGRKYETKARRCYAEQHHKTCGGNVSVKDVGLIISSQFPFLGASVDGIISCSKCGVGILEIKCPYGKGTDKWRNKQPKDCSLNKNFFAELSDTGQLKLKKTHNYYYQVIGQLAVLDFEWADFTIWTKKGLSIERINFDAEFWEKEMFFKLKYFYSHFLTAELFTERVKRGLKLY